MAVDKETDATENLMMIQSVRGWLLNKERWRGLSKEKRCEFILEIGMLNQVYQDCLFSTPPTNMTGA